MSTVLDLLPPLDETGRALLQGVGRNDYKLAMPERVEPRVEEINIERPQHNSGQAEVDLQPVHKYANKSEDMNDHVAGAPRLSNRGIQSNGKTLQNLPTSNSLLSGNEELGSNPYLTIGTRDTAYKKPTLALKQPLSHAYNSPTLGPSISNVHLKVKPTAKLSHISGMQPSSLKQTIPLRSALKQSTKIIQPPPTSHMLNNALEMEQSRHCGTNLTLTSAALSTVSSLLNDSSNISFHIRASPHIHPNGGNRAQKEPTIDTVRTFSIPNYVVDHLGTPSDMIEFPKVSIMVEHSDVIQSAKDPSRPIKFALANAMSASLIGAPDFYKKSSTAHWLELLVAVAHLDPEFILKLAVYTRQDLNIRITANWLLAVASSMSETRPYLKSYFGKGIRLPSDWIEVAQLFQVVREKEIKKGSLPTALRKAMVEKFTDFDEYQLAKYNKDKKPNPTKVTFTMKQLIRKLHINQPVRLVLGLIGKRYPTTYEEFRYSGIDGAFDESMAGKRMKLKIPETWETQVGLFGNTKATWEKLLDHNKLPYMAMLRNLRNMIVAQISSKHQEKVIRNLKNPKSVKNSRQFPFRFFSAYEVLDKTMNECQDPTSRNFIPRYIKALDAAIRVATRSNVTPIKGKSILFANIGDEMRKPCTTARGMGKPRELLEAGLLLALMCKVTSEDCDLSLYSNTASPVVSVKLKYDNILQNVAGLVKVAGANHTEQWGNLEDDCDNWSTAPRSKRYPPGLPIQMLHDLLISRVYIDKLIIMTNSGDVAGVVVDFLSKYRRLVNPKLLYVQIDLSGKTTNVNEGGDHDIFVSGFSDAVLRYIAERGDSAGQVAAIENIPKVYSIKIKESTSTIVDREDADSSLALQLVSESHLQSCFARRRSITVFISSTFRDMHGERDILTRFVFPELRARACQHGLSVHEIDLRWGVTEEMASNNETLSLCLSEANDAQYFIGILGDRYGWIPSDGCIHDQESNVAILSGRSITEIEMDVALQNTDRATLRSFFAFRSQNFLDRVPKEFHDDFAGESNDAADLLNSLKLRIRESGSTLLDGYPAVWTEPHEGKPAAGGLDEFGSFFLKQIWEAISRDYNLTNPQKNNDGYTHEEIDRFQNNFVAELSSSFVGRTIEIKQALRRIVIERNPMLVIHGSAGMGKTAFAAKLCQEVAGMSHSILWHFAGVVPGAAGLTQMLRRFCRILSGMFAVPVKLPHTRASLRSCFHKLIKIAAERTVRPIALVVDGAEAFESNANEPTLEWVPGVVPEGVTLILTTSSAAIVKALRDRDVRPVELRLTSLTTHDRQMFVNSTLGRYRKILDESSFNNQMREVISKREASCPQYLSMLCEELRVFSVYEQLTQHIKQLPGKQEELFAFVCTRLEQDIGKDIVCRGLQLLTCSRAGFKSSEFYDILNVILKMNISRRNVLRLWRSLSPFACSFDVIQGSLRIKSEALRTQIARRYFRGSQTLTSIHRLLATFYKLKVDPTKDHQYLSRDGESLQSLAYHQTIGMMWKDLQNTLCQIRFIQAMFATGKKLELIDLYSMPDCVPNLVASGLNRVLHNEAVQEFKGFVVRNINYLDHSPILTHQQAVNDIVGRATCENADKCGSLQNYIHLMRWLNKPSSMLRPDLSFAGVDSDLTGVSISSNGELAAISDMAGSVQVVCAKTGSVISSFAAHGGIVMAVCFVGNNTIVTAGSEMKIAFWHARYGTRKAERSGFTRRISALAASDDGTLVVACSWDGSAKCFRAKDGQNVCDHDYTSPANTIAFHRNNRAVAIGYWDGSIHLWDTFERCLMTKLTGHAKSIQSLSFAPSGVLLSCSIDGQAKLWGPSSPYAELDRFDAGNGNSISSCRFSIDGSYFLTTTGSSVVAWQSSPGQLRTGYAGGVPVSAVNSIATHHHKFVIVGYRNGKARILTRDMGKEIAVLENDSSVAIHAVASHPLEDVVAISAGGKAIVFKQEGSSWYEVMRTIAHRNPVTAITISEKGDIATGGSDGTIVVSQLCKPSDTFAMVDGHDNEVTKLAFVPDTKGRLISVSKDGSLGHWKCHSVTTGRGRQATKCEQQQLVSNLHDDWINDLAILSHNTNQIIATASNDCSIKLCRFRGMQHYSTLHGHAGAVISVSFLSAEQLLSGGVDGSVRLWTVVDGAPLLTLAQDIRPNAITSLSSKSFLVAADSGILCYDIALGHEIARLKGHDGAIAGLAVGSGHKIATCGRDDRVMKVWNVEIGKEARSEQYSHRHKVTSIAISSSDSGSFVCSGDQYGEMRNWCCGAHSSYDVRIAQCHISSVTGIEIFSYNRIVSASEDGTIKVLSRDFDEIYCYTLNVPISRLTSHVEEYIACGDWSGNVHLLKLAGNVLQYQSNIKVASDWISSIHFRPDGRKLVCTTLNGITAQLSLQNGSLVVYHSEEHSLSSRSCVPTSVVLDNLEAPCLFTSAGKLSFADYNIQCHCGPVHGSTTFQSESGDQQIVSAGADGAVRVWQVIRSVNTSSRSLHQAAEFQCQSAPTAVAANNCNIVVGDSHGHVYLLRDEHLVEPSRH